MKRTTLFLLISALLCPFAARAQSATPPAPQPAYNSLDSDPAFKRLPLDEQAWIRQTMDKLNKAVAAKDIAAIDEIQQEMAKHQAAKLAAASVKTGAPAPNAQTPQPGCTALPVKKPRFHLPKSLQDAIDKQAKQLGSKTGVALDPNAPAQAVNDAQGKPCPASPAPKPANQ